MLYSSLLCLHLIAIICWFAGLFYLPRLFVYHASAAEETAHKYFKVMEYKLYYYIMHPAMLISLLSGIGMIILTPSLLSMHWLDIKLVFVFILLIYHLSLGKYLKQFKNDRPEKSEKFFRIYNEVPSVLLIIIIILAVIQPFS